MAQIAILIGGHLCTAPRPQKEAAALAAAGHQVTVLGVWFEEHLAQRDGPLHQGQPWTFRPVLDFRPGQPGRGWVRVQARLARLLYRRLGWPTPALLGYGARPLLAAARAQGANLTIVHSEAGLWVGQRLLDAGQRVGVDLEDWFAEDLLPSARRDRPVAWLAALEQDLLRRCAYRLTTSQALATALATRYQVPPPTVIYNLFPQPELPPITSPSPGQPVRLHWFSQTLGPGRGLELLFAALPHLEVTAEVYLRGRTTPATESWLATYLSPFWRKRVHLLPTVANAELPAAIAAYDIGLALEQPHPPSRNLTVTNKLFQYLQGGLAVVATDTAGQREVLEQVPAVGRLVPATDAVALAAALSDLAQPEQLRAAKAAARATRAQWSWARAEPTVVAAAAAALAPVVEGVTV